VKKLDAADTMFYADPFLRDLLVLLLFLLCQCTAFGFLLRLMGGRVFWFIALIATVLPQLALWREAPLFLIGQTFVVLLASDRLA
jgi:hypothetical protein